ncbi:MAG: PEP/pyruvate-binding domain-containing protein, partial [Candidatus Limnocylindria bacterium]
MSADVVRRLRDVRMSDATEVGGKAASLGELFAAGVRVPEGVVMTAEAAAFTAPERRWDLANAEWGLGPGPFAVRSSGISEDGVDRSFAGMYETVLEVAPGDLGTAVERCLASARAARVTEYERGTGGRMAVIVQRMVAPVAAGVALTADPITGDRASSVVTAVRGLGDRLV